MTPWRIRPAAALVAVPWRNGLGTTRDIVTVQDPAGELRWQVSIADLAQDAAFSDFPHCDRIFTAIAGDPPPELAVAGRAFAPCPLLVPQPFPGDVPTRSRIPTPGRAFNAIADRRHHGMEVVVLDMGEGDILPDATVAYCHMGRLAHGTTPVSPGDALVSTPDGTREPVRAQMPSRVILVMIGLPNR